MSKKIGVRYFESFVKCKNFYGDVADRTDSLVSLAVESCLLDCLQLPARSRSADTGRQCLRCVTTVHGLRYFPRELNITGSPTTELKLTPLYNCA